MRQTARHIYCLARHAEGIQTAINIFLKSEAVWKGRYRPVQVNEIPNPYIFGHDTLALDWEGGFKSNTAEFQNICGTKLNLLIPQIEKDNILFTTPLSPLLRCNCLSLCMYTFVFRKRKRLVTSQPGMCPEGSLRKPHKPTSWTALLGLGRVGGAVGFSS